MSKVVIAKGKDIAKRTYSALKEIDPKIDKKVLIKPNLVEPMPNNSGAVTRKELLEGLIEFLEERGCEIMIGEGSAVPDTSKCFRRAGYYELAERYKIKLVDLNKGPFVSIKGTYWSYEVAKLAKERCLVSAAVLKEHPFGVTLSLKNLMGCIRPTRSYPTKAYIHKEYDVGIEGGKAIFTKRLVDLARAFKLRLALIDATTAMFGSHLFGKLKRLDLTITSEDALACDLVGARLLGHKKVPYLELALKERLGKSPTKIKKISIN